MGVLFLSLPPLPNDKSGTFKIERAICLFIPDGFLDSLLFNSDRDQFICINKSTVQRFRPDQIICLGYLAHLSRPIKDKNFARNQHILNLGEQKTLNFYDLIILRCLCLYKYRHHAIFFIESNYF